MNADSGWRSWWPVVALVALVALTIVAMLASETTVGWIALLILLAYGWYLTPRAIRDWQRSRRDRAR
jgi:O-antigen ligase